MYRGCFEYDNNMVFFGGSQEGQMLIRFILSGVLGLVFSASAGAATYKNLPYIEKALFGVKQAFVIQSIRNQSACGAAAPSFEAIKPLLPKPKLGVLSDGGVGWRYSYGCKRWVPVRGVVYTAQKTGTETIVILGDSTDITIRP